MNHSSTIETATAEITESREAFTTDHEFVPFPANTIGNKVEQCLRCSYSRLFHPNEAIELEGHTCIDIDNAPTGQACVACATEEEDRCELLQEPGSRCPNRATGVIGEPYTPGNHTMRVCGQCAADQIEMGYRVVEGEK